MPLSRESADAAAAAHARDAELADRERRRGLVRAALECLAWAAAGLLVMGWGFHTADAALGPPLLLAGAGLGSAGVIFAVLRAYRRGERRGDW